MAGRQRTVVCRLCIHLADLRDGYEPCPFAAPHGTRDARHTQPWAGAITAGVWRPFDGCFIITLSKSMTIVATPHSYSTTICACGRVLFYVEGTVTRAAGADMCLASTPAREATRGGVLDERPAALCPFLARLPSAEFACASGPGSYASSGSACTAHVQAAGATTCVRGHGCSGAVGRRGLDMRAGRSKRRGWAKPLRRRGLQPSAVSHRAGAAVLEGQARRGRQCMLGGCRQLDGNAACMQLLDAFRRASLPHCACERYCEPAHRCCCARRTPTAAAGVCQRRRCCKDQEGGAGVDLRRRSVDASV